MDTKIKAVSLKKRLVTLFFSMLSISAFTFGGGFVIVTLMKRRFVDDLEWLDENEMLDMTAIAQSCPGAIAVNGAILVGQRVAGAAGIIVATVATIIPPMVILSLVSYFYALFADNPYVAAVLAGMQAGVAAVIVDVVLNLGMGVVKTRRWLLDVIMVAAFAAAISGVNVIYIILTSGVIGVICAIAGRGRKPMLLDLFLCFVQVGLFSIGGGYAAMPMIQAKAVEHYHWLTMGEFTDLMTIAEMTPGPITVNSATFVGIRMAGIPGALVATMGCILPSLIIVSLLSWLYEKYRSMDAMQAVLACLRPAVVALIASAALTILRVVVFAGGVVSAEAVQMLYVALFAAALVVLRVKHSNPILVMVCCGAVSLIAKFIAG